MKLIKKRKNIDIYDSYISFNNLDLHKYLNEKKTLKLIQSSDE